jgi:hypothetical protein
MMGAFLRIYSKIEIVNQEDAFIRLQLTGYHPQRGQELIKSLPNPMNHGLTMAYLVFP